MTTAAPSTALATIQPAFTGAERLALAGFLAGYRGLIREAYALDLRQFTTWCRARSLNLFAARRADIEGFARERRNPHVDCTLPTGWPPEQNPMSPRSAARTTAADSPSAAPITRRAGSRRARG